MTPATFTYGPWLPDLANVGQPTMFGPVMGAVPAVDCLNVYYANANYICMPGPVGTGPSLGTQSLTLFDWYDNTGSQQITFAGTANGISALASGAWSSVPVFNAASVAVTGLAMSIRLGGFASPQGMAMTLTLGAISASGQLFNGTLTAGSGAGGAAIGFDAGFWGALTPSADSNGHTITVMQQFSGNTFLKFSVPSLGATYFNTLSFPAYSKTFNASSATYTTDGSTFSQWEWSGGISVSFTTGNTPVVIA